LSDRIIIHAISVRKTATVTAVYRDGEYTETVGACHKIGQLLTARVFTAGGRWLMVYENMVLRGIHGAERED